MGMRGIGLSLIPNLPLSFVDSCLSNKKNFFFLFYPHTLTHVAGTPCLSGFRVVRVSVRVNFLPSPSLTPSYPAGTSCLSGGSGEGKEKGR